MTSKDMERQNKKYPTVLAAYVMDQNLPSVTAEDAKRLTHLNVAFGLIQNHMVQTSHLKNLGVFPELRQANPQITIILSIGGWGAGGFSEAAATRETRKIFVDSAITAMLQGGFDGIDIDWEYPCIAVAGIAADPKDKVNFTALCKELREALNRQSEQDKRPYFLSIAAGADQYFIDSTEMDQVQEVLDLVQLMTYDMRGGFQTLTGHHTGLFTGTGDLNRISVDASVQLFLNAGVPRHKIVIGAAFYARKWKGVPDKNHGLYQMAESSGGYGARYGELVRSYIDQNGYKRYWDDEAKAPYLFNGNEFISYDDPLSLKYKAQYVRENGLRGIMYWEHGGDETRTLLQTLYEELFCKSC